LFLLIGPSLISYVNIWSWTTLSTVTTRSLLGLLNVLDTGTISDIFYTPLTPPAPQTWGPRPPISCNSICYLRQKRLLCRRFSPFVCLHVTKEIFSLLKLS